MMERYAVDWTEWLVHIILFWESDNKKKGRILRAVHNAGVYALLTLIIVSHVIYPAFWFQSIVFGFCLLVWIQHILTNGCVISKVEQRLLEDENSFLDPYLELLNVKTDNDSKPGILILISTVVMGCLGLEWLARVIYKLKKVLELQVPISEPILRILAT